jgi:hypothetical protein
MNSALAVLGDSSASLSLYDFYIQGVLAATLATAYALALAWVEERLEAARLCFQFQVHASHISDKSG